MNKMEEINRIERITNQSIKYLETEIEKLRELKSKGKFSLQQSEFALRRLAEKIATIKIK